MTTWVQLVPPLMLTPATRPRDPPFDHRSCCQPPPMSLELRGLTPTIGWPSLFGTLVTGWPATLSAVHEAKALVPETWTSESRMNPGGSAHTGGESGGQKEKPRSEEGASHGTTPFPSL